MIPILKQAQKVIVLVPVHVTQQLDSTIHKLKGEMNNKGEMVIVNHEQLEKLPTSSYDVAISYAINKDHHSDGVLATIIKLLKPKGTVLYFEPCTKDPSISSLRTPQQLAQRMTLFGFVDTVILQSTTEIQQLILQLLPSNITLEQKDKILLIEITTHKPQWEVGATAKLNFSKKTNVETKPDKQVWLTENFGDELIDDDELLSGGDSIDSNVPGPSGCGSETKKGGKKPCKNCSCGLAEEPKKVTLNLDDPNVLPKSSCGSCYLGDAFRCTSCPYMGLPSFKLGEKIQLTASIMADDI